MHSLLSFHGLKKEMDSGGSKSMNYRSTRRIGMCRGYNIEFHECSGERYCCSNAFKRCGVATRGLDRNSCGRPWVWVGLLRCFC